MMKRKTLAAKLIKRSLWAFVIAMAVVIGINIYFFQKEVKYSSSLYSELSLDNGALQLQDFVDKEYVFINELASNIAFRIKHEKGISLNREEINNYLNEIFKSRKDLFGIGVLFEPNAFDGLDATYAGKEPYDATGSYMFYVNRIQPTPESIDPGIVYAPFYAEPKTKLRSLITNPYEYEIDGKNHMMIIISCPIIIDGKFCGVVASDIYLDTMRKKIEDITIYDGNSSLALLDNVGKYALNIEHPELEGKNLVDVWNNGAEQLNALQKGNKGYWFKDNYKYDIAPIQFSNGQMPWQLRSKVHEKYVYHNFISAIYWLLPILLIGILGFVFYLRRLIQSELKPLEQVSVVSESIANGNLTQDVKIMSDNEIGVLSKSFKQMLDKLNSFISEIQDGSEFISTASNQLNGSSQSLSSTTNELASVGEEISCNMEEMSASIQQNAHIADKISTKSNIVMNQMNLLNEEIRKATNMHADISGLVKVVSDISRNVKVLALNAAVEAARAGENGKGFSVVAREVQKLSEDTAQASLLISEKIKESTVFTTNASDLVNKITPDLNVLNDDIITIRDASEEQSVNVQQVTEATQNFNNNTQYNASAAEELASTADEMNRHSERLLGQVGWFKIK